MEKLEKKRRKKNVTSDKDQSDLELDFEDFHDEEEEIHKPKGPLSKLPSWRKIIPAVILFIIFFICTIPVKNSSIAEDLWISGNSIFHKKEIWRIFTSIFMHGDMQHLLSNGPFFLLFGWMLRAYFGMLVFPFGSLIIGAAANLFTIIFYEENTRLIGASGMIYGMAAQWLVYYVRYDVNYTIGKRIFRSIGFAMALLFPTTIYPSTSYLAHGAGFFLGIIISLIMLPLIRFESVNISNDDSKSQPV